MHTSIPLLRVTKREQGERVREQLEGASYMNLHVAVCPAGGEFQVVVETRYEFEADDNAETMLLDMVATVLAGHVAFAS